MVQASVHLPDLDPVDPELAARRVFIPDDEEAGGRGPIGADTQLLPLPRRRQTAGGLGTPRRRPGGAPVRLLISKKFFLMFADKSISIAKPVNTSYLDTIVLKLCCLSIEHYDLCLNLKWQLSLCMMRF